MKKTIFTYIFTFFFCLLFILGAISEFIYRKAFNAEEYIATIEKNDYDEVILEAVRKKIDDMGDIITIDSDEIYKTLNEKEIVEFSKDYTKKYLEAFLSGKDFKSDSFTYSIKYTESRLRELVEAFYKTEETNFSEEEFQIIFEYIENQINSSLRFLSKSILDKTTPFGKYAVTAKNVFKSLRLTLIPSAFLILGIILLNIKDGIGTILYKVGACLFFPSAILFIPTCLFDNYNLGEKIVLGRSPLSVVFSSILDTLIKGFEGYVGIFFIVAFVLILVGAAFRVFTSPKTPSKKVSILEEEPESTHIQANEQNTEENGQEQSSEESEK